MNIYILVVLLSVFIASISQILLKKSALNLYSNLIYEYLNIKVVTAYIILALSILLNLFAMKMGVQLKEMPIIESLGYLFVLVFSYVFLNEKLSTKEIVAAIFIISGIFVFYL
jgi:uncharacterized membrane protein